jgi:AcrR family transcriptional regulator
VRGRRSAAEAARTRARLVGHAERLFARRGYNGTSLRDLARVAGVQLNTVRHHFGSKLGLYEEILRQWDREVAGLVSTRLAEGGAPHGAVGRVVDALFDFCLINRRRLALAARTALGEGLPPRLALGGTSWVRFMRANLAAHRLGVPGLNLGLFLITVEGIVHHHVLARAHYRQLFGRDVTDPAMAAATKRHLTRVILALVGPRGGRARPRR